MLRALIKIQFLSAFRSYYINPKTNKPRSRGSLGGMFCLFGFLMLYLAGVFFSMGFMIGTPLFELHMDWLYLAIMSMLAIMLGVFGSVFNTYASMYLSKDNELLLSMPVPTYKILISRISLVFGLSLLYGSIVWIPACLFYWIFGNPSITAVLFDLVLAVLITLLVTVITCALGYLVALFSRKLKNKSFTIVIISLLLFSVYYVICFRASELMQSLVLHADSVGQNLKRFGNLFYLIGQSAGGNVLCMLGLTALSAALTYLCLRILSSNFLKIITASDKTEKVTYNKEAASKSRSAKSALFQRELKHFISSPTYMLNSGLGIAFMLILSVLALIKKDSLMGTVQMISEDMGMIYTALPVLLAMASAFIMSLNTISTPSISLEGKTLWILRSLPVRAKDVLDAKLDLHVKVNLIPAAISMVLFGLALDLDTKIILLLIAYIASFIWFNGTLGLILGLKNPNFHWTSEAVPIKQSINILLVLGISALLNLLIMGSYFPLSSFYSADIHLMAGTVIFYVASALMHKWLREKGAEVFMQL